jgi:hypothetical protein
MEVSLLSPLSRHSATQYQMPQLNLSIRRILGKGYLVAILVRLDRLGLLGLVRWWTQSSKAHPLAAAQINPNRGRGKRQLPQRCS